MASSSRFQEWDPSSAAEDRGEQISDWAARTVDEYPVSTLCTAFAAGVVLGVGAVAAYCAADSQARHRQSENLTARIGEAVSRALPEQLKQVWRS